MCIRDRLTDEDVEELKKIEGVQSVNPSYSQDVLCQLPNSQPVLHLMTLTPDLNQVTVEEGRLPEKADEIFLDRDFFHDYGYQIGDKVQVFSGEEDSSIEDMLNISEFTIVGEGTSPFYLSIDRGTSTVSYTHLDVYKRQAYNRGRMDIIKETDLYKKYQKMCDIQGRLFELVISIGTGTIIKMNPAAGFISRPM